MKIVLLLLIVLVIGLLFLLTVLTRGIIARYLLYKVNERISGFLFLFHLGASVLLALILPNNFLAGFSFFKNLYAQNGFWIPLSMLGLLLVNFFSIGIALSAMMWGAAQVMHIEMALEDEE